MMELKNRLGIIAYIVKKMTDSSKHQIGTTTIQKMVYLLNRKGFSDYSFKMYHYGPYSNQVSQDITSAGNFDLLNIEWIEDKGYDIKIKSQQRMDTIKLPKRTVDEIDLIIADYGKFNAVELSLIATAYYVIDNTDVGTDNNQLVTIVSALKPNYSDRVERVLKRAKVIPIAS